MRPIHILIAALFAFIAACNDAPNPSYRDDHDDHVAADAGSQPEVEDAARHHRPTHRNDAATEADAAEDQADQANVPDAAVEENDDARQVEQPKPDAAVEPDQGHTVQQPDAEVSNPQPRQVCVEVSDICTLFASASDQVNDNGDPQAEFVPKHSGRFCFDGDNLNSLVNVQAHATDENGNLIWGLSVTSANEDGDWCSNDTGSNVRVDETCFIGPTPRELGFTQHCTEHDGPDSLNWLWEAANN